MRVAGIVEVDDGRGMRTRKRTDGGGTADACRLCASFAGVLGNGEEGDHEKGKGGL